MAVKSYSNAAKAIIRREIGRYKRPKDYGVRSVAQAMKKDADAYNCGDHPSRRHSDYQKGAAIVDAGFFAVGAYQDDMLGKIYGKKKVQTWSMDKRHEVYRHLIGREYDAMLREERKKASAPAKKPAAKKPSTKKPAAKKPTGRGKR